MFVAVQRNANEKAPPKRGLIYVAKVSLLSLEVLQRPLVGS